MAPRKRPDLPRLVAPVLEDLRIARQAMIRVETDVQPFGPAYNAASAVMKAIDAFAALLTGDPEYFWEKGSVAPDRGEAIRRRERETGRSS